MVRQLYLFRHAEAVNKIMNHPDKERELTSRGVQQSVQMGSYLSNQKINPDAILSSASKRTVETITLATDVMKFNKEKIFFIDDLYEASTRTFLEIITN